VLACVFGSAALLAGAGRVLRPKLSRPVKTESGLVAGVSSADGQVQIFKGIPYAAPPVGNLRWRAPEPAPAWKGVREVTEFSAACPQGERTLLFGERIAKTSEDCLYLNIWAPVQTPSRHVPVMVWIHGGGFTQGTASMPTYDGEVLARRGAVVVTLNYRLGPFGFFAHPLLTRESGHDTSGNYGLLDQMAALRWVQANIRAFGGSPDRVTVFGESAGAASIACLLVAPQAHGLFQAAILESGSTLGITRYLRDAPPGEESMEEVGELIARRLGCDREDDVLTALRSRSVEDIMNASHPAPVFLGEGIRFAPVVDRWLIPDRPSALFAKKRQWRVPMIVGANGDEGTIFVAPVPLDIDAYRRFVRATFRDHADEVLARFPVSHDWDVKPTLARLIGVSSYVAPARRLARSAAELGDRAYLYSFTRVRSGTWAARFGAFHGAEIPFIFSTWGRGSRLLTGVGEPDDVDRALSQAMMGYWVRFAATGDPNGEGATAWPRYNPHSDLALDFGDEIQVRAGVAKDLSDFFDRVAAEGPAPKKPSGRDAAGSSPSALPRSVRR
jgi:para-nitrobenzyl esterase